MTVTEQGEAERAAIRQTLRGLQQEMAHLRNGLTLTLQPQEQDRRTTERRAICDGCQRMAAQRDLNTRP